MTRDEDILELVASGQVDAATVEVVRTYGDEIRRFVAGSLDDRDLASDTFARWSEAIWRALGQFRGDSSVRTWCYTIARRELAHAYRRRAREQRRQVNVSTMIEVPVAVRSETERFLRTDVRSRLHERCRGLPPEDRELLALRVDQKMSWLDIGAILDPEATDRRRVAARIRKRYERLKDQLRSELELESDEPPDS